MKSLFKTFFCLGLVFLATEAFAGPPMKVIYSNKRSTTFKWKWPYQTTTSKYYLQTKPYYYTGRLLRVAGENVSKYRYPYQQRTYMNEWGYFFKPGAKFDPRQVVQFGPPEPQHRVTLVGGLHY